MDAIRSTQPYAAQEAAAAPAPSTRPSRQVLLAELARFKSHSSGEEVTADDLGAMTDDDLQTYLGTDSFPEHAYDE